MLRNHACSPAETTTIDLERFLSAHFEMQRTHEGKADDPVGKRAEGEGTAERSAHADVALGIGGSEYDRDEGHDSFRQGGSEGCEDGAGCGLRDLEALADPLHPVHEEFAG